MGKMSSRERIMMLGLLIVAFLCSYVVFFLNPTRERLSELKTQLQETELDIVQSADRTVIYAHSLIEAQVLEEENEILLSSVPSLYDRREIVKIASRYIESKVDGVSLAFNEKPIVYDSTEVHRATYSFTSTDDDLDLILESFKNHELLNRILSLRTVRSNSELNLWDTRLDVEFLVSFQER